MKRIVSCICDCFHGFCLVLPDCNDPLLPNFSYMVMRLSIACHSPKELNIRGCCLFLLTKSEHLMTSPVPTARADVLLCVDSAAVSGDY
jgi:hypothetical protein